MNATVNARLFLAAATFAGVKDVRRYICSVRIEPAPCGVGVVLVATDGHRLVVLHDETGTTDEPMTISTHKRPAIRKGDGPVSVTFSPSNHAPTGMTAAYSDGITLQTSHMNDDRYPDWQAVIPFDTEGKAPVCANPKYLGDFAVICQAYERRFNVVSVAASDRNRSMLCTFDSVPAFAVLMPCRVDIPEGLPLFMSRPVRQLAEAA